MDNQNLMATRSPITTQTQTQPPPSTPVLEQALANSNRTNNNTMPALTDTPATIATTTVPEVTVAVGVESNSVAGAKPEVTVGSEQGLKKKRRGRPRKDDADASWDPLGISVKRSRDRPSGSRNLQLLASTAGGLLGETAGRSFTPHVLFVNPGEDLVDKIIAFTQKDRRSVCVITATGSVANAILRQPGSSGGAMIFEGRFDITYLSGSCTYGAFGGGAHHKNGMLSISLANSDGAVFGGAVEGPLIAYSFIQLVLGSFMQNFRKEIKRRHSFGSFTAPKVGKNSNSKRVPRKVPKMTEGQKSCPPPTFRLKPMTNGLRRNVMSATTITPPVNVIPAITNGVPVNVIPATTIALPDNVIPATTVELPGNVIPATTNGVPINAIPATTITLPGNVIPATTNGLLDNIIRATTTAQSVNAIPATTIAPPVNVISTRAIAPPDNVNPATNIGLSDNVIPLTTIEPTVSVIPATTIALPDIFVPTTSNGVSDIVIPTTTIALPDIFVPATTSGVPDIDVPTDHNMHYASVHCVGLDS